VSMISPGEWMDGVDIKTDPRFASRIRRPGEDPAEILFSKVLYAAETANRQGLDITVETIRMQNAELSHPIVVEVLQLDKFHHSLAVRGIPMSSKTGLTAHQLSALSIYMDMTTPANHRQRLRLAGVTQVVWDGWNRQPAFAARLSEVSEDRLAAATPIALRSVVEQADMGKQWAVELVLEMNRRHDRRQDIPDPTIALRRVFDVLDEILPQDMLDLLREKLDEQRNGAPAQRVLKIAPPVPPAAMMTEDSPTSED
jgi:hypothetical protein